MEIFSALHTHATSAVAVSAEIPPFPASSESSVRPSVDRLLNTAGNGVRSGGCCLWFSARSRTLARIRRQLLSLSLFSAVFGAVELASSSGLVSLPWRHRDFLLYFAWRLATKPDV